MQAIKVLSVGNPWASPEINWKKAIWIIIIGVLVKALMRILVSMENKLKLEPFFTWSGVSKSRQISWKEHEKVMTQAEDPTGAPRSLSLMGASVSCQVHHKNRLPKIDKVLFFHDYLSPHTVLKYIFGQNSIFQKTFFLLKFEFWRQKSNLILIFHSKIQFSCKKKSFKNCIFSAKIQGIKILTKWLFGHFWPI